MEFYPCDCEGTEQLQIKENMQLYRSLAAVNKSFGGGYGRIYLS